MQLPDNPFSVYLITNTITEKWYVGKTGNTVWDRWTDHKSNARRGVNTYLYRSIRKHGEENFRVQTVATIDSEDEANNLERLWILLLKSYDENFGYNLTFGGDGVRVTEATRAKLSRSHTGKKLSEETRARLSASLKGRKLSPEHVQKISDRCKGVPLSEEHKKKLSEDKQGVYVGENHPMFGKNHSPGSIEKMVQSHLGQPAWNKGISWSEEVRNTMAKSQKTRFQNPEQRENLSQKSKLLWENPEYRAKMKLSQDARYAREREKQNAA